MKKAHLISLFIGFSGFLGSNLLMAQESWQSQLVTQDKTGNLNDLLLTLKDSNVSVDYLYLSFNRDSGKPIMVFHTEDIMEVRSCLKSRGYTVL